LTPQHIYIYKRIPLYFNIVCYFNKSGIVTGSGHRFRNINRKNLRYWSRRHKTQQMPDFESENHLILNKITIKYKIQRSVIQCEMNRKLIRNWNFCNLLFAPEKTNRNWCYLLLKRITFVFCEYKFTTQLRLFLLQLVEHINITSLWCVRWQCLCEVDFKRESERVFQRGHIWPILRSKLHSGWRHFFVSYSRQCALE
jgi:hypothetical protein